MPWYILLTRGTKIELKEGDQDEVKKALDSSSSEFLEYKGQVFRKSGVLGVVFQEEDEEKTKLRLQQKKDQEMRDERMRQMEEWRQEIDRMQQQSPEEKTDRIIKTWFSIFWFCRTKKWSVPADKLEKIKKTILDFFKKNPREWHCPRSIYEHFLPFFRVSKQSNSEFESIAEILSKR